MFKTTGRTVDGVNVAVEPNTFSMYTVAEINNGIAEITLTAVTGSDAAPAPAPAATLPSSAAAAAAPASAAPAPAATLPSSAAAAAAPSTLAAAPAPAATLPSSAAAAAVAPLNASAAAPAAVAPSTLFASMAPSSRAISFTPTLTTAQQRLNTFLTIENTRLQQAAVDRAAGTGSIKLLPANLQDTTALTNVANAANKYAKVYRIIQILTNPGGHYKNEENFNKDIETLIDYYYDADATEPQKEVAIENIDKLISVSNHQYLLPTASAAPVAAAPAPAAVVPAAAAAASPTAATAGPIDAVAAAPAADDWSSPATMAPANIGPDVANMFANGLYGTKPDEIPELVISGKKFKKGICFVLTNVRSTGTFKTLVKVSEVYKNQIIVKKLSRTLNGQPNSINTEEGSYTVDQLTKDINNIEIVECNYSLVSDAAPANAAALPAVVAPSGAAALPAVVAPAANTSAAIDAAPPTGAPSGAAALPAVVAPVAARADFTCRYKKTLSQPLYENIVDHITNFIRSKIGTVLIKNDLDSMTKNITTIIKGIQTIDIVSPEKNPNSIDYDKFSSTCVGTHALTITVNKGTRKANTSEINPISGGSKPIYFVFLLTVPGKEAKQYIQPKPPSFNQSSRKLGFYTGRVRGRGRTAKKGSGRRQRTLKRNRKR